MHSGNTKLTADDVQGAGGNDRDNVHHGTIRALAPGHSSQSVNEHSGLFVEHGHEVVQNFEMKRGHEQLPSRAPFGALRCEQPCT